MCANLLCYDSETGAAGTISIHGFRRAAVQLATTELAGMTSNFLHQIKGFSYGLVIAAPFLSIPAPFFVIDR